VTPERQRLPATNETMPQTVTIAERLLIAGVMPRLSTRSEPLLLSTASLEVTFALRKLSMCGPDPTPALAKGLRSG
jgi:hypothetical protein